MHISREGNLVTLINGFETTPEQQQALIEQWLRCTGEVRQEPGYLGTALHRSADGTRVVKGVLPRQDRLAYDTYDPRGWRPPEDQWISAGRARPAMEG